MRANFQPGVTMNIPAHTELSNFDIRSGGRKAELDLSVVLLVERNSDPVDAINAAYQALSKADFSSEFILLNMSQEGFQYDTLLQLFPQMRVLLPREKVGPAEAIMLAASEALSRNILLLDEHAVIETINLEVLRMYLSENNFGILLPLITDAKGEIVPNCVKAYFRKGMIDTVSMDIVGSAITSLYPKYFGFMLNRDALKDHEIELNDYSEAKYTLLELGYRLWKAGFVIIQTRPFRIIRKTGAEADITPEDFGLDYAYFCAANLTEPKIARGRSSSFFFRALGAFFSFRLPLCRRLFQLIGKGGAFRKKTNTQPVEDSAIFTIINKDIP